MRAWGTIQLTGPVLDVTESASLAAVHQPTYVKFKAYRAEVIEAALFLESRLEVLLCRIFVGTDQVREQLFRSLVLDPESGSFFQKWRMLRGAFEVSGVPGSSLSDGERKALLSSLQRIGNDRNKFAHGNLYIDVRDGRPLLEYYEGSKKQEYLSDASVEAVLDNASATHVLLERVITAAQ